MNYLYSQTVTLCKVENLRRSYPAEILINFSLQMRNFFKPKKHGTEQKWHSILNEDNSKAFESEMTETLIQVNCFITKIEIESSKMDEISK